MHTFFRIVTATLFLASYSNICSGGDRDRPNIIVILVDDLGYADLGCFGSVYYETPNLDRLATQGTRFTNAYAECAVCSPTRAALLTGRYPVRTGVTDWIRPLAGQVWTEAEIRAAPAYVGGPTRRLLTPRVPLWLEHDEVTLAERLGANGYATGFVGKWHLGPPGWFPENQGFDFNAGGCDFGHPPDFFDPYPANHQATSFPNLPPRREGEYLTDREADEAVGFIRRHRDEPFFLYLCHYAVHSPIQGKAELIEKYTAKPVPPGDGQKHPAYAAMVQSVDEAAGRILGTLDELDLSDNTIIIFTSDNGGATHFPATDNRPLRSGKGRPYEGGLRVPLIVRWPEGLKAGVTSDHPISTMDIFPTVCEVVGGVVPNDLHLDGVSLLRTLNVDEPREPRPLFWHYPHYWWGDRVTPYSVVRLGPFKLIYWYETGAVELYDLSDDIGEENNLAATRPEKVRELKTLLNAWIERTGAKLPMDNPDFIDAVP